MSKTFDDFCMGFQKCGHNCPLYNSTLPCRATFEAIQEYLERDEEEREWCDVLAFIKGYLLVSLVCNIIFLLLIQFDCGEYPSNDPNDWNWN